MLGIAARRLLLVLVLGLIAAPAALAQCPASTPVQGGVPPGPLPVFPPTNWWNLDVSSAAVDPNSAGYIAFINNGGTRRLHPDFGGEASPGSVEIYGMPYAIVDAAQPKQAVTFEYWDESDGVDPATGRGLAFYPIPAAAITEPHWVEGGAPASVDQRSGSDRHLLLIDCTNHGLYELYNVYFNATQQRWYAGSGAYFDLATNSRRPDTWTSADAAGLAIFPGLVRYDEAWNPAVTDIGHAFRVTVRATNGYVYPASHRAGSTAGALPLGARLRLKTSVGGQDPALRTADPNLRKIFRSMQKHGLIVADNGSDLYVTGTFDPRWNNDILNPAFATLTASDFDVIALGWNPSAGAAAAGSISATPATIVGGNAATGTVTLTAPAATGGALVTVASASAAVTLPSPVLIAQGVSAATFTIASSPVAVSTATTLSASYGGITVTTTLMVTPPKPVLATLTTSGGGSSLSATVTLSAPAPDGGAVVTLKSANAAVVKVPASVVVPAGATAQSFPVTTMPTRKNAVVTLTASYAGVTRTTTVTVARKARG